MRWSVERRRLRVYPLVVLFLVGVSAGCITRTDDYIVQVTRGSSHAENMELALAAATPARLEQLKREIRRVAPHITDEQLRGLSVGWKETTRGVDGSKDVIVLLRAQSSLAGSGREVVDVAGEILDRELGDLPKAPQ